MGFGISRVFITLCVFLFALATICHGNTCSNSTGCYGPGIGSDGLANTVVGGPSGNLVSYRFRAGHSGSLQQIHVYLMQAHTGYSAGTGGQLQVTLNADDGTAAHNPSSTVLATYLLSKPLSATPSIYFPLFVFTAPPSLVADQLYHIVFRDVDPNPVANYLSVNALYYENPTTPAQPTISDMDGAVLLGGPNGTWAPRKGYLPILELDYQDGFSEWNGYMEVWVGAPQSISATAAVRETITVSGAPKNVASATVRVARLGGSDPLIVRLENGDGSLIEQGEISAAAIPLTNPASYTWATFTFSSAHTLLPGQIYNLQFGAASTSTYQAFPIRKGLDYGFQNTTYFADGYAQFNQTGTWIGWTQWGVTNRADSDLQFYFSLASNNSAGPTISNVAANSLTSSGATISWTTDQPSTSQVDYGTTTAYGNTTAIDSNSVTSHVQVLTGLVASTLYHYRVHSTSAAGIETISGDLTFSTSAVPIPAPIISNVVAVSITTSGATVTWTTDQAANSRVEYGPTISYGTSSALSAIKVTTHSQVLSGLLPLTVYHYRVHSTNATGSEAISGDFTFATLAQPPVVAPVISSVAVTSITSSGATIKWITDQSSTTQVQYGTTTSYGHTTTLNNMLVKSHAQSLIGLSSSTVYHYRLISKNASGVQAISGDFTFATARKFGR